MSKFDPFKIPCISQMTIPTFDFSGIANAKYNLPDRVLTSYQNQLNALTSSIDYLSSIALPEMQISSHVVYNSFSPCYLNVEAQVAKINSMLGNLSLPSLAEMHYYVPDNLSESLASHLAEISTQFSESLSNNADNGEELSNSVAKAASSVRSGRLSLSTVCSLLSLLVTIFVALVGFLPDSQLSVIISAIQETKELEQRIVELQEEQIDIHLRQLEEEQKQVELLEQIKDDIATGE